ncbi:MAG: radical SAM protein [Methanotrichaceae archaeon]|nr:radical SAM protein [Methanotrichaceae archaeon]
MEYLFGPVLSRRLGLSMGVDLLQYKTCNLDCVYCELGKTICLASCRSRFVPPVRVLNEIKAKSNDDFDHLTFAGSGEPTLSVDLGEIVLQAKEIVDAPIAIITNSTLLMDPQVRKEVALADIVLPSLDAITQKTFQAINRPASGTRIEEIIHGLKAFRNDFDGEIWLEVMLVKGLNDHEADLIAKVSESIEPERIQLNTVVRTPTESVMPLDKEEILKMLELFPGAEVIPDWDWRVPIDIRAKILDLLSKEPCTIEEIEVLLHIERNNVIKYISILERDKSLSRHKFQGKLYFKTSKKE